MRKLVHMQCHAAFVLGLFVCAAGAKDYLPPDGGPTATLEIFNHSVDAVPADAFEDAQGCREALALNEGAGIARDSSILVKVAADAPITLRLKAFSCAAAGSFVPQRGRHYLVRYQQAGRKCRLTVTERTRNADGRRVQVEEKSFKPRLEKECL